LTLATWLRNSGTNTIRNISAEPAVLLNGMAQGPFMAQLVDSLLPGERRLLRMPTGWTPTEVGVLELSVSATSDGIDEDPLDNMASTSMRITGPGWADGYGAMASFEGIAQGTIQREGSYTVLTRMELEGDETAVSGVSTVLGFNSSVGGRIRGVLFDAQLAFVDTTATQVLSVEDMNTVNSGGPLYLPWANVTTLSGDHFVGIQVLDGDGQISVATSGTNPVGAAMVLTGANFEVEWLQASPMIRLHTSSFGVTVNEVDDGGTLVLGPNPASTMLWYWFDDRAVDQVEVTDVWGRAVRVPHYLTAGRGSGHLDVSSLSNGCYTLTIHAERQLVRRNFLITR
jgi:hypothetical protein